MHSSKVYMRLQEQLGLSDHAAVLNLMLSKIAKNLQAGIRGDDKRVINGESYNGNCLVPKLPILYL